MFRNYVRSILSGQKFHEADTGANIGGSGESQASDSGENGNASEGEDTGSGNEGSEGGPEGSKSKSKSFTQDDVNAIAAREAKKATEKLLKQLGVSDFKSAKDGLDKFKEIQDSQKSDIQKATEKASKLEGSNKDLANQVNTLNAQLAALKADVNPDSLHDVIVLANNLVSEDTSIDDAIKQVLKKYPNFKRQAQAQQIKAPKFTEGEHKSDNKPSEQDQWMAAFNVNKK